MLHEYSKLLLALLEEVNIRTEPMDLLQGEVDSVSVKGKGLVMQKELRAEKMQIETNSINIEPMKAALGDIELHSPTDARMLVILKQEDIQRAFNSDYVKDKLKNLSIYYQGNEVLAEIEQVEFILPETDKVLLKAELKLNQEKEKISFTAIPQVNDVGNKIQLQSIDYEEKAEYNQEIAKAIIKSAEEILDLKNFELDEMSLRVRKLDVQLGKLTIEADAVIEDFPD